MLKKWIQLISFNKIDSQYQPKLHKPIMFSAMPVVV